MEQLFYSTNGKASPVSLKEAVFRGLPPDNGLYMPLHIPVLDDAFFKRLPDLSFSEIAAEVGGALFGAGLPETVLRQIIDDAFHFEVPLVRLNADMSVLELFHGPTLAFKDFGARFMARLMGHLIENEDRTLTILVATSGDTGSAVANGFYNVPGIRVIILYPSGLVSQIQEKQLTTLGGNISALEIEGDFDACQSLTKQAFLDEDLQKKVWLTSANSINIARLLPQTFYYFKAVSSYGPRPGPLVFSVPSGNYGNLTAGLIARKMGLPCTRFIAASNINNSVPRYLETGRFMPGKAVRTLSNAMDVGAPSNFTRILDLFGHNYEQARSTISGASFNDDQTRAAIRNVYEAYGYVLDPHGAVGYLALTEIMSHPKPGRPGHGIVLETAHPAKFRDTVRSCIGVDIPLPLPLQQTLLKEKRATKLAAVYSLFRQYLFDTTQDYTSS